MSTTSQLSTKLTTENGNNRSTGGWSSIEAAVELLLNALGAQTGGVPTVSPTVEPNFESLGASASFTIPQGSKGWTAAILTGTGSIGGINVTAPFADGDSAILGAGIVVTTDAASSAYIRYGD